jgi:hypothetical protein
MVSGAALFRVDNASLFLVVALAIVVGGIAAAERELQQWRDAQPWVTVRLREPRRS